MYRLCGLVVGAVVGCAGTSPEVRLVENPWLTRAVEQLVTAPTHQNVATLRKMLGDSVTYGGMWFADPECTRRFPVPGVIRGPHLDAFATCLATLRLAKSPRKESLEDVAILTYDPGIEIEARLIDRTDGPWLAWIGYEARRDLRDGLPTISSDALEGLRLAGDRNGPLAQAAGLEQDYKRKEQAAHAWLKICIDDQGAVTGAHIREASSPKAGRAFTEAVKAWRFRPFTIGGHPIPACSMVLLVDPPGRRPKVEALPYPLPEEPSELIILPSEALGHRVFGQTLVTPDDQDKVDIVHSGVVFLLGAFQLCIDGAGRVSTVNRIRSTGIPAYDRKIVSAMRDWVYKPYLDEGTPVPVCSAVTFIYHQR